MTDPGEGEHRASGSLDPPDGGSPRRATAGDPRRRESLHSALHLALKVSLLGGLVFWFSRIGSDPEAAASARVVRTAAVFAVALILWRVRRVLTTLKVAIGVALVVWLFGRGGLDVDRLAQVRAGWPSYLAAQLLFGGCIFLTIARWRLLLRALGVASRFRDALRLGMVGVFFNQFAPGGTGGDLVKAFYIAKETPGARSEAVLSVFLDRVIGLLGLMVLGGLALFVNHERIWEDRVLSRLGQGLVVLVAGSLLGGALLCWERFWRHPLIGWVLQRLPGRRHFARLAHALWTVRGKRRLLGLALLMSIANHAAIVGVHLLLARAMLGELPPVGAYAFAVPVALLVVALPTTPGGYGVGEMAYQELFRQLGRDEGLELAVLVRATWLLWGLVGMTFYLVGRREITAAFDVAENTSADPAGAGEVDLRAPRGAESGDRGPASRERSAL